MHILLSLNDNNPCHRFAIVLRCAQRRSLFGSVHWFTSIWMWCIAYMRTVSTREHFTRTHTFIWNKTIAASTRIYQRLCAFCNKMRKLKAKQTHKKTTANSQYHHIREIQRIDKRVKNGSTAHTHTYRMTEKQCVHVHWINAVKRAGQTQKGKTFNLLNQDKNRPKLYREKRAKYVRQRINVRNEWKIKYRKIPITNFTCISFF